MLIFLAGFGAAAFGGFVLAMTTVIHSALHAVTPHESLHMMQRIIPAGRKSPAVLVLLPGTLAIGLVGVVFLLLPSVTPGAAAAGAGWLVFAGGALGVSRWRCEPLYDRILALDSPPADWQTYLQRWRQYNVVRSLSALLAALLFFAGLTG